MKKLTIEERIINIEKMLLSQKTVLTFKEAAHFIGFSESYLYKLTMAKRIPFFRPLGKMIYFDRDELEKFIRKNRVDPQNEE